MMTDTDYIEQANKILESEYHTRRSLAAKLGISRDKLDRIARSGLIPKYPRKLTVKQAASMRRKTGSSFTKFRLWGSPTTPKKVSEYDKIRKVSK